MIVQDRTGCDLVEMLKMGLTAAWTPSKSSLRRQGTTRVHVVNWDGTARIEGDYSEALSIEDHPDHPRGRTVIAFTNAYIVLCRVDFEGHQNPVSYHDLSYEAATRAEPSYASVDVQWPKSSHLAAVALYEDDA